MRPPARASLHIARVASLASLIAAPAGCSSTGGGPDASAAVVDLAVAVEAGAKQDLARTGIFLTTRFATEIAMSTSEGGGAPATSRVLALWTTVHGEGAGPVPIQSAWGLCALDVPGLGAIPFDLLDRVVVVAKDGSLSEPFDGARLTQPPLALVFGAHLARPIADALPAPGSPPCDDVLREGCAIPDDETGLPGIVLVAPPGHPELSHVSVALRLRFGVSGIAGADFTFAGTADGVTIERRVLGCRKMDGAACTVAEAAAIDASLAPVTVAPGGPVRAHQQGFYFTCPKFLDDTEGGLTGFEVEDGGMPGGDMGAPAHDPETSFTSAVQGDIDRLGCGTYGCHDPAREGTRMPLYYRPSTEARRRANYEAVLPFARSGRLLLQAPLPRDTRERWDLWITRGLPY